MSPRERVPPERDMPEADAPARSEQSLLVGSVVTGVDGLTLGYIKAVHRGGVLEAPLAELVVTPQSLEEMCSVEALAGVVASHLGVEEAVNRVVTLAAEKLASMGGQLSREDVLPAYAYHFGLAIPYTAPVFKKLMSLETFRAFPDNAFLGSLDLGRRELIEEVDEPLLRTLPEIFGEWFSGRVRGVVSHAYGAGGSELSARTGLAAPQQVSRAPEAEETVFHIGFGETRVRVRIVANVPLRNGEPVLIRGWYDPQVNEVKTVALLKIDGFEQWAQRL